MDFTLALTHFCEAHGPKSVLSTQVLPLKCVQCQPPSPSVSTRRSSEALPPQAPASSINSNSYLGTNPRHLHKTDTNLTLPTDFSGASTTVDSGTDSESPTIEKHPLFQPPKRVIGSQYRYGRAQGDTCASCSFSVPTKVAEQLPEGAPGSQSGRSNSASAPVLRSREFVCLRERRRAASHDATQNPSLGSSLSSSTSRTPFPSHSNLGDCHDHTITYMTTKAPDNPEIFAQLRASVIRTLSCELLPRGMSDGPFCFGDSNTGYTIAYVFRLTDPKARGRRRAYAFIALAGKDASRAFRACPMLWEAFAAMAKGIESAAQRHQEVQRQKEEASLSEGKPRNYTPVSSFLTSRSNDPDGHPRRTGHATPRSLAEIVGDENIFTILHQYFVAVIKCLGDQFGGMPMASNGQSVGQETATFASPGAAYPDQHSRRNGSVKLDVDSLHLERLRDDDATPTPMPKSKLPDPPEAVSSPAEVDDDLEVAKTRANKAFKLKPHCAPKADSATAMRQVVV
ncbi:hypothetical protein PV10_00200 [Exophiala mesophila]|uniref:UDENN FLCN/SMCR8-type domain-containing protein n=1 Tax=Exophiala mesophila TaxID=212818 RepID=A0A0D2ABL4_EXOME|nr:uncharacterized protein PV10_00200 [Exophiala mesophila]KIV96318.1 hypothetical protein PV10_00200 [Exophiala mesophila]